MEELQKLFRQSFGHTAPFVVKAPGRVELLGNHTDYNQGLVMALAVNRFVTLAASPRQDGKVELVSSAFPERATFWCTELERDPRVPWADYVKGVLQQLRTRGVHFGGFNAAIHGTIPVGAGLSSSAALEVATALAVRQLHPYSLTSSGTAQPPDRDNSGRLPRLTDAEKLALAQLCQQAENEFVGVRCGLLDQVSTLFGRAAQVIQLDCLHNAVSLTPLDGDAVVVLCESGVKHRLAGGEYNRLRRHCEAAAKALAVKSLRFADMALLKAHRSTMGEREYQCAYHILGENQRVVHGERALARGDLEQFGQYLYQSHESSRDYFHNSCPELDTLVEIAREHPACYGSRLTGGGFGGATLSLVRVGQLEAFVTHMQTRYRPQTEEVMEPMRCQVVDGAGEGS